MRMQVAALLLALAVLSDGAEAATPNSHKDLIEQAAAQPKPTDSAFELAKKAAITTSESVTKADTRKVKEEEQQRDQLRKLVPALDAAAVGVAQQAAAQASKRAQRPYAAQYRSAVRARVAAERGEAEAEAIAQAVHRQVTQGAQEAVEALKAEQTVANELTKQKLAAAALLQARLAALQAQAPQEVSRQAQPLTALAAQQVQQKSASKVVGYTRAADAEVQKVAQDKANLATAKAVFRQASHLKTAALNLAKQRTQFEAEAKGRVSTSKAKAMASPTASSTYAQVKHAAVPRSLELEALGGGDDASTVVPEALLSTESQVSPITSATASTVADEAVSHLKLPGSTFGTRNNGAQGQAPWSLLSAAALVVAVLAAH